MAVRTAIRPRPSLPSAPRASARLARVLLHALALLVLVFAAGCAASDGEEPGGDRADRGDRPDFRPPNADVGDGAQDGDGAPGEDVSDGPSGDGTPGEDASDGTGLPSDDVSGPPPATDDDSDTGEDSDSPVEPSEPSCTPGDPSCDPNAPTGCCIAGEECVDFCTADRLETGRSCSGCDDPGGDGTCGGGQEHTCDASASCSEVSCGGNTWWCTERNGQWRWRTDPGCDDGDPCTQNDQCSSGTCAGEAYTCSPQSCGSSRCDGDTFIDLSDSCDTQCDGEGGCQTCTCEEQPVSCAAPSGGCCEGACNAFDGCVTTPGSCAGQDDCSDPNVLQIGASCQGCGDAFAEGTCGGGTTEVCDETTGGLCRQVTCGGVPRFCTNVGGQWEWRTASACDDGDLCTHGDVCAGGACVGTAVDCSDDQCNLRSCNGTATCTSTPLTGETCDDGSACTAGTTCTAGGTCGGGTSTATCGDGVCECDETPANCPADCQVLLPGNACTNGNQNRTGCSNSRTISRGAAAGTWSSGEQNTCSGSNQFSGECGGVFDVGNDHVYAIYMLAGERVSTTLDISTRRCNNTDRSKAGRLKLRFNPDTTAAGAGVCPNFEGCYVVSPTTRTQTRTYDAAQDGWLFIIVDGGASGFDEHRGYYTLSATMSRCLDGTCGC